MIAQAGEHEQCHHGDYVACDGRPFDRAEGVFTSVDSPHRSQTMVQHGQPRHEQCSARDYHVPYGQIHVTFTLS
ncbi:Uncharacterised protein [Mycobacteroides abscessus subsp. abscessus]|uniref:Uncharacterized protein n=2 Tax=Mycobacteroides abscessus TaxID=36809 RepID=A0A829QHA7_9MYCO|nr:hypothetical protein I543_4196 [Mycobacteroides abscessus 21]EUA62572.1 hypothetical protein I542_2719 [Mycobacteroides abscessus 1948]CPZ96921.1 Uncharacterised protein [Mycobacteroides abscessus]SHV70440.1 Uncharacterised protein [Mycobacteroides abscessus subsp. abscessus]SHY61393.1 Uncharacterised protein [Mycobacteroides abscessus subsp. abscessus]